MKVWVVSGWDNVEGEVLAVCSSEERAKQRAELFAKEFRMQWSDDWQYQVVEGDWDTGARAGALERYAPGVGKWLWLVLTPLEVDAGLDAQPTEASQSEQRR